jgi:3-(methylthio)propionyl---CoA ligase
MMPGMMMDRPLLVSALIEHAEKFHGAVPIVARDHDGGLVRTTYAAAAGRARRLAKALLRLGVRPGERVATMAWNGHRHFELYYGISGIGAVMHTINPRLPEDQIAYVANHARDTLLFVDPSLLPLAEALRGRLTTIHTYVALAPRAALPSGTALPDLLGYEDLLEGEDDGFAWPRLDERSACSLCYTSGTTGRPRGALYSHRSTVLHTMNCCAVDGHAVSGEDCVLPAVQMYHGNAWGVPYSATAAGAKLVLAGRQSDGATLFGLFEEERVTFSLGVPTVWLDLLAYTAPRGLRLTTLRRVVSGGSAVPQALVEAFRREHGVRVVQAWGMTEMNPLGATAAPRHKHLGATQPERDAVNQTQGRPPFLVDMRIVGPDGAALPHDGRAAGELQVRGPWVISGYFDDPAATAAATSADGWLATGDICSIDPDGYLRVVDRAKDMIKSGGEWISSIALEDAAAAHPDVAEAAAVAVPHPRWGERPLLLVVAREGHALDAAALRAFMADRLTRWWLPDEVLVVAELPRTATGKVSKATLRERYRTHRLPYP